MPPGKLAPDRREDVHAQHPPAFPLDLQPIHDRPDRQAGNSVIRVKFDEGRLARAQRGFVVFD